MKRVRVSESVREYDKNIRGIQWRVTVYECQPNTMRVSVEYHGERQSVRECHKNMMRVLEEYYRNCQVHESVWE